MLLEEVACGREIFLPCIPIVAIFFYGFDECRGISCRDEFDRFAIFGLRRISGAEFVYGRASASHAFIDFVSDYAGGFGGRAEHPEHDIMGGDHFWHFGIRNLVKECYVFDSCGFCLRFGLVGAPAEETPVDAGALRHARGLYNGFGAVQGKICSVIQHAEVLSGFAAGRICFLRLEYFFIGSGQQYAKFFARDSQILFAEIDMAGSVPAYHVWHGHEFSFACKKLFRPPLFRFPLFLLEHFFVPSRNHRIEYNRNPSAVGPATRGCDIALASYWYPYQIRAGTAIESPEESFDISESRPHFDKKTINIPAKFAEKRNVDAVARITGIKASPPKDAFFLLNVLHTEILPKMRLKVLWYNIRTMKCELCHKNDAKTVLMRGDGESEEELYVCEACAKAERIRSQRKSQRTRKIPGLPPGISMSVTEISGPIPEDGEPPPIIAAIANAFQDMASAFEKKASKASEEKPVMKDLPVFGKKEFIVKDMFHLEGLHLIGELEAVKRAFRAVGMELSGVDADGVKESGHVYRLRYSGPDEKAMRMAEDMLREERNARVRLRSELPRVFGDSLCRALAILKNCRLLNPGELFDLLSPIRLAAEAGVIEGISLREIDGMLEEIELDSSEDRLEQADRDKVDADRADAMNRRFEEVMLNDIV